MKILIFKVLYFLILRPIFVGSLHNFDKSDMKMTRFCEKCLFLLDAYMVSCPTSSKSLGRALILKCWIKDMKGIFYFCEKIILFLWKNNTTSKIQFEEYSVHLPLLSEKFKKRKTRKLCKALYIETCKLKLELLKHYFCLISWCNSIINDVISLWNLFFALLGIVW